MGTSILGMSKSACVWTPERVDGTVCGVKQTIGPIRDRPVITPLLEGIKVLKQSAYV